MNVPLVIPALRTGTPAHRFRLITFVIIVALTLAACGRTETPNVQDWSSTWDRAQDIIPGQNALARPPRHETCQDVLGALRDIEPQLHPAPDRVVETAIDSWMTHAEHTFFTCFDNGGGDAVDHAYETLARLQAEVDIALRTAQR